VCSSDLVPIALLLTLIAHLFQRGAGSNRCAIRVSNSAIGTPTSRMVPTVSTRPSAKAAATTRISAAISISGTTIAQARQPVMTVRRPLRVNTTFIAALLRRLLGRRAHGFETVGGGRRDGGAHHQPRLVRRPGPAAMHGGAVVPHQ